MKSFEERVMDINERDLSEHEDICIRLKVPESGNPEIDRLITESRRWDIAQVALAGWVENLGIRWKAHGYQDSDVPHEASILAFETATALIEKLKGGKT